MRKMALALTFNRRKVLALRRYIVPQRETLSQLVREGSAAAFFSETDALYLRESVDRVTRLAEDLDAIRERSVVLQEQIMEERSDLMNQRLFVLSRHAAPARRHRAEEQEGQEVDFLGHGGRRELGRGRGERE